MPQIVITQLEPVKLPLIQKLYKAHYPSAKAKRDEAIFVSYHEQTLCGVVRLRPLDRWRLLTGMLVTPEFRSLGIGHALLQHCHQLLRDSDYCFAYSHLEPFYRQHGFVSIEADLLPAPLLSLFRRYTRSGKSLIPMKFELSQESHRQP